MGVTSTIKWVGKAALAAEVDEIVFALFGVAGETVTFQLRDEGNTLHTVITTLSGTPTNENSRDQVLVDLQASVDVEFQKITWTASGTDKILGTAKNPGVPFHLVVSETSALGTLVHNTGGTGGSTATSGPNDYAVVANWENEDGTPAAAKPAANDDVLFAEGSDDVLYSLQQNALTPGVAMSTINRSPGYRGTIGQPANGFRLTLDVTGSGDKVVRIDARNGGDTAWAGTCPTVVVQGSPESPTAVDIAGDVDDYRIGGAFVRGRIKAASAMTLDNVFVVGVRNAVVELGENIVSLDLIEADSGNIVADTNPLTLKINGTCSCSLRGTNNWTAAEIRGNSALRYEGEGNQTGTFFQSGGSVDLRPRSEVSFGTVEQSGGTFTDRHANNRVTYTTAKSFAGAGTINIENQVVIYI